MLRTGEPLRHALTCCICLSILLSLGACAEEESAQRAVAAKDLGDAMAMFNAVDTGFVPAEGDQSTHQTLDAYRQDTLADAAERLEPVLNSPSATQRQAARQLLADIHASAARHVLREASTNWTQLAGESVNLLNVLLSVDRASARVRAYQIDDSDLLKQLEEEQIKTRRELSVMNDTASVNRQRIADLQAAIKKLRDKRDASVAEGRRYRDQAFPMTGEQRYNLYEKASQVEREGQEVFKEAQLQSVDLNRLQSEQAVLDRQIETKQSYLESIEKQIQATKDRQRQLREALDEAQITRSATIKKLEDQISQVAESYHQRVDAKFDEASKNIAAAVKILTEASEDQSDDSRGVKLELLSKVVTQVHVRTAHVLALADFGQTLAVIAGRADALMPGRAEGLQNSAEQIAEQQGGLIGLALAGILRGQKIAGELTENASEGDPIAETANAHNQKLADYRSQLETLKLPGLPDDINRLIPLDALVPEAGGTTDGGTDAPMAPIVPTLIDAKFTMELLADALKAGDADQAMSYFLTPSEDRYRERLQQEVAQMAATGGAGELTYDVGDGKMQGDWAVLAVTFKTPQGEQRRDTFLYLQDGEWKLVPEGIRGDEAIRPLFDDDAQALLDWYREQFPPGQ